MLFMSCSLFFCLLSDCEASMNIVFPLNLTLKHLGGSKDFLVKDSEGRGIFLYLKGQQKETHPVLTCQNYLQYTTI